HQLVKVMTSMSLQFRARQHRFPDKFRILQILNWHAGSLASLKRTTFRKVSLEPGSIDFEPSNVSRPPKLHDCPIVSGSAPSFGFPAVAHVCSPPRHDQIMAVAKEHVAA